MKPGGHWNIVRLSAQPATRWRNGGGITRELAAWPPGAGWSWRMSVADVERNGPFSAFEGTDRWFAVMDGAGVRLAVDGGMHALHRDDAPFRFDGAMPCHCELVDGATRDFNLMLNRVKEKEPGSRMSRVNGVFAASLQASAARPATVAVYAVDTLVSLLADGELIELPPACLAWKPLARPAVLQVQGHALLMEIRA